MHERLFIQVYIVIVVIWDQQAVQKDILLSEAITGTLASIGGYL